ncbi:MAG: T9SS type A sorting domain-containing protein [Crocinitomicaceae bacterium]|nr:T9SS type A sorting domain-containing protein [Crocinitomicaceae bacterium]
MIKNYSFKQTFIALSFLCSAATFAQTTVFNYTGAMQTYVVPAGVTEISVDVIAAGGGLSMGSGGGTQNPGNGGRIQADLTVVPGTTLNIYVGGAGTNGVPPTPGVGGFNGGGNGGNGYSSYAGGGGGGASDIRIGGTALNDRVIVAGGGGGGAYNYSSGDIGGAGGGLTGGDGLSNGSVGSGSGTGGTQSAGGNFGVWSGWTNASPGTLGTGGHAGVDGAGGGGGGGYYGGGGGAWSGGGGGSSYSDAVLAASVIHTVGYNSGNGQISITPTCDGLTTTVSSSSICIGESVTLSATSTNGGTVTWDNGITDGVAFTPVSAGTTTYTATSTDLQDCSFIIDIVVNDVPTVDGGVDVLFCGTPTDTFLQATGTGDTYTWDNGITDGAYFTPVAGTTTYTVTAEITATGCTSTDQVDVIVNDAVVINLTSTDEMTGNDGTISLTVTSGTAPITYDWDNDGTGDFNDTEDLSGLAEGSYTVVVNANGCLYTETIAVGSQVGIENSEMPIAVYPNPAVQNLTVEMPGTFLYNITDISGNLILTANGSDKELINVENFAAGIYFIRIENDNTIQTVQFVKN